MDFVECADGFYNKNCSGICGVCVNDEVCEKTNGICENGCKTNFQGPLCQGILPTTYSRWNPTPIFFFFGSLMYDFWNIILLFNEGYK